MDINILNNLRVEYSIGNKVIMFSFIDTSETRNVLVSNNITKIIIEYSWDGNSTHQIEKELTSGTSINYFHMNSIIMIIDDLPENQDGIDVSFKIFFSYYHPEYHNEKYKIQITNTITERTLPHGNITYNLIETNDSSNDNIVRNKIVEVLDYINNLGTCVTNENFDEYATYAKTIPIRYDKNTQTASAYFYKTYINISGNSQYGLVQTSGGVYSANDTIFHELRHRYGITRAQYAGIERNKTDNHSDLFNHIKDKYSIIHDAARFETGRSDAKIWVCYAHSNIPEGNYTNNGSMNYLAANYIKALVWYTCHTPEEQDTSKIRIIAPLDIKLVSGSLEEYSLPNIKWKQGNLIINNNTISKYLTDKISDIYLEKPDDLDINNLEYSTSNPEIVTINNTKNSPNFGKLTIVGKGTACIYATFTRDDKYLSEEVLFYIKILLPSIIKTNPNLVWYDHNRKINEKTIEKTLSYNFDNIYLKIPTNLNINNLSYESSNPDVATIDNDGKINALQLGETYITAIFVEDSLYISSEVQFKLIINNFANNKFYLSTIIRPYLIDKSNTDDNNLNLATKVYLLSNNYNYNNNFINTSLNITLFPYTDLVNNIYTGDNNISPSSVLINNDFYFILSSRLGFDNGVISLINEFIYPSKVIKDDNKYDPNYDEKQVTKFYNSFFIEENKEYYEREDILDDLDFPEIRTTGYVIQISTDIEFKDIVYESKINTDNSIDNFIYDFSFSLDKMFTSWNQLSEILVVRAEFIDKKLNNIIKGNPVIISKEWFKYLINDINDNIIIYKNQNNLKRINFMDVNNGFNLINNIECTVIDKDSSNISFNKESSTITTKILYKPIFYKVNDLQNIKIRKGVKQNIGINLGNFLTKVDLFILNIGDMNFKESSRNDMYVIFSIDENKVIEENGTYNILNQDFEYISSGNYTIY